MILQSDTAAADDGNAERMVGHGGWSYLASETQTSSLIALCDARSVGSTVKPDLSLTEGGGRANCSGRQFTLRAPEIGLVGPATSTVMFFTYMHDSTSCSFTLTSIHMARWAMRASMLCPAGRQCSYRSRTD